MSVLALLASTRCRSAVERWSAVRLAFRSRRRLTCAALKEPQARLAPPLLDARILGRHNPEQCAREHVGVERVGARCDDEFAELANAPSLAQLRLVGARPPFRIQLTWLAHCHVSIECR